MGQDNASIPSSHEPLAITGIGCRFPGGATTPNLYWKLLVEGRDAVSEVPASRWSIAASYDPDPGRPGRTYSKWGGFVDGFEGFDAGFFGISATEAARMDPQQRALLEVAWEALEDGGHVLDAETARATGVYVGVSSFDYSIAAAAPSDNRDVNAFSSTGTALSIVANRLSYALNLGGPSLVTDTACSSSLVALHLACQSLWRGETRMALAAGVNYVLLPLASIGFCSMSALSRDGRCKPFDARADGFVRAEGAGVVVLKPLSRALADGDHIYATILATGVNQDGRTPGMTLPSQAAQERLARETCRAASVAPTDISYVEAHGTGTAAGDPIEAGAIGQVFGMGRPEEAPCIMGSVKGNLGHLEAAAGIAGLVKVALMLERGQIPRTVNFETPNPAIDFDALRLRVPRVLEEFPTGAGKVGRFAAINSFGFGGTNAHAVLSAPPDRGRTSQVAGWKVEGDAVLLTLSARSAPGLSAMAGRYAQFLGENGESSTSHLGEVCRSAAVRRAHHTHRLAVTGRTRDQVIKALQSFAGGETAPNLVTGPLLDDPRPVFVFSGQGQQWWGMSRSLIAHEPVFSATIDACHHALLKLGGFSLRDELLAEESASRLQETAIAQPAITAVQVALTALLESWGVRPVAVVGHSVGEVAAAHAAGAFDLETAMRVIYHRGRTMERASSKGRMLAVGLPAEDLARAIEESAGRIALAAINAPRSVTLSGEENPLQDLAAQLSPRDVFCRFVPVEYAFHSAQMDPVRDELLKALDGLSPSPTRLPLFSTVTGGEIEGRSLDAEYWWRNVRETVQFAKAVRGLRDASHRVFVEVSAHPVLKSSLQECLAGGEGRASARVLETLRRGADDALELRQTIGSLHCLGHPIDWNAPALAGPASTTRLPTYPWQHEDHWFESPAWTHMRTRVPDHPLLDREIGTIDPTWSTTLDLRTFPYLQDHVIQGRTIFPGAAYIEMALAAGQTALRVTDLILEDMVLERALFLGSAGEGAPESQFRLTREDGAFSIQSKPRGGEKWTQHARGRVRAGDGGAPKAPGLEEIRRTCVEEVDVDLFYDRFAKNGLEYGSRFRGAREIRRGQGSVLGRLVLPSSLATRDRGYLLHPALLDSCLQLIAASPHVEDAEQEMFLPVEIDRVRFVRAPGASAWGHMRRASRRGSTLEADLAIYNDEGALAAEIQGFRCRAVPGRASSADVATHLYSARWKSQPLPPAARASAPTPPARIEAAPSDLKEPIEKAVREVALAVDLNGQGARTERDVKPLLSAYLLRAFNRLGGLPEPGQSFDTDGLAARLGIVDKHRALLKRFLRHLAGQGVLIEETDGRFVVTDSALQTTDAEALWTSLVMAHPAHLHSLQLTRHCALGLPDILSGKLDPLEHLFGERGNSALEEAYARTPIFEVGYVAVREAVLEVSRRCPEGRSLRVLEVGTGTGALTSHLLPVLDPERCEYLATDISPALFERNRARFARYPWVEYRTLDLERSPSEQGFDSIDRFDVVVGSDVMHATRDLGRTFQHLRSLLNPGGILAFMDFDAGRVPTLSDLIFGTLDGWWHFEDRERRPDYVIPTRDVWLEALGQTGFGEVIAIDQSSIPDLVQHTMYVARAEGSPSDPGPTSVPTPVPLPGARFVLFADQQGTANGLAQALTERGARPVLVAHGRQLLTSAADRHEVDPANKEQLRELMARILGEGTGPAQIVYLWPLDMPETDGLSLESLEESQDLGARGVLRLAQALSALGEPSRLTLITRGADNAGREAGSIAMAQTPIRGLARVIMQEEKALNCRTIDLDPRPSSTTIPSLLAELLLTEDAEEHVALRNEARYVQRVVRWTPRPQAFRVADTDHTPSRLEFTSPGTVENLVVREMAPLSPGPGEIRIRVHAAALNFRDLLKTVGMYPEVPDVRLLGDECAGVVIGVGEGVTSVRLGDRVAAIAPSSLATEVVVRANAALPLPEGLSFEAGAGLIVAFLTADYALNGPGQLAKGERVLIHSGAGGVGMAAIQLAKAAGAEVFATAGSAEKRELLKLLGVDHVMDSRSLSFAEEIMSITSGEGIDVVLNSLAGGAIQKGLSVLRENGRFLELGKRDIYGGARLDLRPFRNSLSFIAIDLARFNARAAHHLTRLKVLLDSGRIHPLPYEVFPLNQAVEAFKYMAKARHVGKIVLRMSGQPVALTPALRRESPRFEEAATYLVTGGLRGFGLSVAEWLVQRGARHLVLTSRTGNTDEAAPVLERLKAQGVNVLAMASDVADEKALEAQLSRIQETLPPLRGVIHAAMILKDEVLTRMEVEDFDEVMAVKAKGAWNLHLKTRTLPLDHFILFSSMAALIGNPGQGNYAAANLFLEALAEHRRQCGLPGLAIGWSTLSEVGYVSRNSAIEEHLSRIGYGSLSPAEAHRVLELGLANEATFLTPITPTTLRLLAGNHVRGGRFADLRTGQGDAEPADGPVDLRPRLKASTPRERLRLIETYLKSRLAETLRTQAAEIRTDQPLAELGLDSLSGIELIAKIESSLGVGIGAGALSGTSTVSDLGKTILSSMGLESQEPVSPTSSGQGGQAGQAGDASEMARPGLTTEKAASQLESDLELVNELNLGEFIAPAGSPNAAKRVLLTGATGFLGAYLLHELLTRTDAEVVCLVRAASVDAARSRVLANLARFGLPILKSEATNRLTVVLGDLARPRLGLTDLSYADLASTIDAVYHNGAEVNHILDYDRLRASNVLGTLEILRFATASRPKELHYTSTLAVFRFLEAADRRIPESQAADDPKTLVNGYAQTKAVAETLVTAAKRRGLPVTIYRPGIVVGDARTGIVSEDDFLWRILQAAIALGVGPDSKAPLQLTTVDFAARAIVRLARQRESMGRTFHLVSPPTTSLGDVLRFANEVGYRIRLATPESWVQTAFDNRHAESSPLLAYLAFHPLTKGDDLAATQRFPDFETEETGRLLGPDLRPPAIDPAYLDVIFRSLIERGVLAAPRALAGMDS